MMVMAERLLPRPSTRPCAARAAVLSLLRVPCRDAPLLLPSAPSSPPATSEVRCGGVRALGRRMLASGGTGGAEEGKEERGQRWHTGDRKVARRFVRRQADGGERMWEACRWAQGGQQSLASVWAVGSIKDSIQCSKRPGFRILNPRCGQVGQPHCFRFRFHSRPPPARLRCDRSDQHAALGHTAASCDSQLWRARPRPLSHSFSFEGNSRWFKLCTCAADRRSRSRSTRQSASAAANGLTAIATSVVAG